MELRFNRIITLFIAVVVLLPYSLAFARILDNWSDLDAYKPTPIIFLHGFALGNPASWNDIVINGAGGAKPLKIYFDKYSPVSSNLDQSIPYLERIFFDDPNGSIDEYPMGKLNPQGNSDGWADKVNKKIHTLLPIYRFKDASLKFILICHSMGGLAAREYLNNPKYANANLNIDKMITIGTPHAGTPIANIKKIEDAITRGNAYIWEIPYFGKITAIREVAEDNEIIKLVRGTYKIEPEGEAIKDMAINSPFLTALRGRPPLPSIKKFAIYGQANSEKFQLLNTWFFSRYYPANESLTCGDGIVPRDSQIGFDIMSDYPSTASWVWKPENIAAVQADHINELKVKDTAQALLQFLDSEKPELGVTSPDPSKINETYESSIHIQGRVYKEYLPADSKLNLTIIRQDDGQTLPPQSSLLKPSDLWIPNNPDSPVAEFDELINFPGAGTYKISCQIENPAGVRSDIKDLLVKVIIVPGTNIIVHCHNPEGKEINSITGVGNQAVIYDGNTSIGYGAYDAKTHNKTKAISAGTHTIKAKFNGMTKEQAITLNSNETKVLTFTFPRTEITMVSIINKSGCKSIFDSYTDHYPPPTPYASYTFEDHANYPAEFRGGFLIDVCAFLRGTSTLQLEESYTLTPGSFQVHLTSVFYMVYWDRPDWVHRDVDYFALRYELDLFPGLDSFSNWIIQCPSPRTDHYVNLTSNSAWYRIGNTSIKNIPASTNISGVDFVAKPVGYYLDYMPLLPPPPPNRSDWSYFTYSEDLSISVSLNFDSMKMSSVPYDLDGKAI